MKTLLSLAALALLTSACSAAADGCCILQANKGQVCVNAPGATCRAHPRYIAFNQKKMCKAPGATGNITCRNKKKNELSAKIAFEQRHITLRHMGDEYEPMLMDSLRLSLENEKLGISIGNHGFGLQLKFGD